MSDPLFLAAVAVLLFWLALATDRVRRWPSELFLEQRTVPRSGTVAVLVPARNESSLLPETLPSLLRQDHPECQVVLIDDGSEDKTGAVAEQLATALDVGSRFRLVRVEQPPADWSGKLFALEAGRRSLRESEAVQPEWLLLTDADIRHPPGSIDALLDKAARGGYDMVSVMARLRCHTIWERVVIPAFVFFFHLLYPFRSVLRRSSSVAAAAGGCVLVRSSAIEALGGFGAIRNALIDDVALASKLKEEGRQLWLGFDERIASVRPYRTLRDLWRMVSRSAFVQLRFRYGLVVAVVVGLLGFVASPPLLIAGAVPSLARSGLSATAPVAILVCAVAAWLLQALLLWPFVRHHRVPWGYSFLLPLAAVLYAGMTTSSAWNHWFGRGSSWKGRSYEP